MNRNATMDRLLAGLITALCCGGPLAQNRPVAGLVLDEAGKPIADVAVCPFAIHEPFVTERLAAAPALRTDAEGRFAFTAERPLPRNSHALLFVAKGRVHVAAAAAYVDMTPVVLPKGNTLAGRVRDPDGKPLAGVRVQARDWLSQCQFLTRSRHAILAPEPCTAVLTDAQGRFILTGTVDTAIALTIGNHGFTERTFGPLAAGQPLDAVVAPAPVVTVQALFDGKPRAGADVHVRNNDGDEPRPAGITDAAGRVAITFARPGKLLVHISDRETFGELRLDEPTATATLELAPMKVPRVDWPVPDHGTTIVRGTLQDPDTKTPVANAWVGAMPHDPRIDLDERAILGDAVSAVSRFVKVQTDADGKFELQVPPGRHWLVAAEPSQIHRWPGTARNPTPSEVNVAAGTAPLQRDLSLQPTTTVRGRLVGGTPPVGAGIRLVPQSVWVHASDARFTFHNRFALAADLTFSAPARRLRAHEAQLLLPRWFRQGLPDKVTLGTFTIAADRPLDLPVGTALPAVVRGHVRALVPMERLAVISLGNGGDGMAWGTAWYDGPVGLVARDGSFAIQEPPGSRSLLVIDLWSGVPLGWTRPATVAPASERTVDLEIRAHEVVIHCEGLEEPDEAWLDVLVDDAHWPADVGRITARGKDPGGDVGVAVPASLTGFRLCLPEGETELRLRKSRARRLAADILAMATWSSRQPDVREITLSAN
ncbi:MAG: hypothetical protein IPK26_31415 [Planctomycetes bacterium]|nr:hypothetical protein [Planctomycetota bacterium]